MISVVKAGKWIAKHRVLILIVSALLMIPSFFGIVNTRVNYDLLSYLPEHLETVKGQDILVDEYGMGAFSMVVVEDMELKDVQKLEEKFSEVPHVKDVLWYDDAADISLPVEMLPKDIREAFFKGEATMMLALFDNTTSSDEAMDAVTQMRQIADKRKFGDNDRRLRGVVRHDVYTWKRSRNRNGKRCCYGSALLCDAASFTCSCI